MITGMYIIEQTFLSLDIIQRVAQEVGVWHDNFSANFLMYIANYTIHAF